MLTQTLSILLALSAAANLYHYNRVASLNRDVAAYEEKLGQTSAAAKSCSESVERMVEEGAKRAQEAAKAVEAAHGRAKTLERAARAEIARPAAIPDDACRSAQVETAEWLVKWRAR